MVRRKQAGPDKGEVKMAQHARLVKQRWFQHADGFKTWSYAMGRPALAAVFKFTLEEFFVAQQDRPILFSKIVNCIKAQ